MEHKTPGMKLRNRAGRKVPYWFPPAAAIKAGYPVKSANLEHLADNPAALAARCQRLQAEVLAWRTGKFVSNIPEYDGTFGTLIDIYLSDPDSPFHGHKPGTKYPYEVYGRKLKAHIGDVAIQKTDGRAVKRWFGVWADQDPSNPKYYRKLAAGRMALCVLKASVTFGVICRNEDCIAFQPVLAALEFPIPKPRNAAPTAQQVDAAREAAHRAGAHGRAFGYALQFETTLRQWDVIGQWVDMSDPRPSAIQWHGKKWIGPTWSDVDENLILSVTPSKTEGTTGKRGVFDLKECPMVMAEIARMETRVGPLVVNEKTGMPYHGTTFRDAWRADCEAAGIPRSVWNRDLRAGGHTEASMGGANAEDRAKVGVHSRRVNSKVYDRDTVEAHRRVMQARKAARGQT